MCALCGWFFHFLDSVLWSTKVFYFAVVRCICFFSSVACAFDVISKEAFPNPRSQTFITMFSSKSFIVLALTLDLQSIWCFVFVFVFAVLCGLQNLNSLTRDWTKPTAVKAQSSNHWTAREFPAVRFLCMMWEEGRLDFPACGYPVVAITPVQVRFWVGPFTPSLPDKKRKSRPWVLFT